MSKRLTEHSQLYSEWHFERNTTIDIEKIVIGSGKKVWWKCNNGHEWQNVINKRAIGKQGCPFCSGRKPSLENNLSITNPELINEWNFKENIIQPQMITYGSEKRVNWICKEGHKWLARVNQRTKGIGCPFCSRLKASEDNNLIITHHEVASEWHWEKNHPLIPTEFLFGSDKIVWWICKIGHEWQLKINKRTIRNQNCPICNKRKVTTEYNLQIEYPEIAKQWHYEKNGDKQPNQFLPNSNIRVWWKCEKNIDHEWDCTINNRVFGSRCPICSGRKVVKSNSLQIVNPILSAQWHPTKNSDLLPKDFVSNSNKKVWWKCNMSEDHEWEATIVNRNKGRGCPMCRGLSVVLSNCLETTHPNIAFQWNFDRNLDLKPQSVVAGSHSKVWWVCNKDKTHEWEAIIKNRTLKNHGCPFCRLTSQSRQELIILFELKYIFDSISPKGFKFKEGKRRFNIDIAQASGKRMHLSVYAKNCQC